MTEAANFFASVVKPTVLEYLANPQDIRRARLAAIVLYHMADHLALNGYVGRDRKEMDQRLENVRGKLMAKCSDFSLIRDVTDATKHAKLSVPKKAPLRAVSSSQQITRTPGFFQAPFGEGVFAGAEIVFVTLDDGTEKSLEPAIRSVMAAVEEQLAAPPATN